MKIKKILLLIIAFSMLVVNVPAVVYAAEVDIIALLSDLKIMQGDHTGDMRLDDYVTRAEFAKIAVSVSPYKNFVAINSKVSPFKDVSALHWSAPYVQIAISGGICKGYMDSTFRPDQKVLFEEAITMILKVLGYTDSDFGVSWPYGQIGTAKNIGLTKNVVATEGQYMTRRDVATLVYNALDTKMVSSTYSYSSNVSYQNSTSQSQSNYQSGYNTTGSTTERNSSSQAVSSSRSVSLGQSGQKLITIFDYKIIENVTLIATNSEDSSVGSNKVLTSGGTFDYSDAKIDPSYVGRRGDLVIKNDDEFVTFFPEDQIVTKYNVTSVMGPDLMLDGKILNFSENLSTYYKTQASTYKNVVQNAVEGDTFITYANSAGIIDYAMLLPTHNHINNLDTTLEQYVVYSKLNNIVVGYTNGRFYQIDIKEDTKVYKDKSSSNYSSLMADMSMGDLIYVKKDNAGNVEYVNYENKDVDGPYTISNTQWMNNLKIASDAAVMRNGVKVNSSDVKTDDIVYFSEDLNIVFAYSNKVIGVYEKAVINKDTPSTVTVSGVSYEIEGLEAFSKLSSGGVVRYGDTVTLLLGKTNQVADVKVQGSVQSDIYGYLYESGMKEYTTPDLNNYVNHYFKVVMADGNVYEYMSDTDYSSLHNSFVRVTFAGGEARAYKTNVQNDIYGVFDWEKRKFGKYTVADDVAILDIDANLDAGSNTSKTLKGEYIKVYPQRIDGINIGASKICYVKRDSEGVITEMILDNVTGDMSDYALLTGVDKSKNSTRGTYEYNLKGTEYSVSDDSVYNLTSGTAVKLVYKSNGSLYTLNPLKKVEEEITDISLKVFETADKDYLISDDVVVYSRSGAYVYDYKIIPLSDIVGNEKDYSLTAYYDKESSLGGRIRIIVAVEK